VNYSATQYALFSSDAAAAEVSGGLSGSYVDRSATAIFHRDAALLGLLVLLLALASRLKPPAEP
jgi:hypothetical protein